MRHGLVWMLMVGGLAACDRFAGIDDTGSDTADTGDTDSGDSDSDSEDSGDTDSGDTADTEDTADTDTADSGDTGDTGDTEPVDTDGPELILSEVVSGAADAGWVEITNLDAASVDLSAYSLGHFVDGDTTLAAPAFVLSGTLADGESIVVAYESDTDDVFDATYGFAPDLTTGAGSVLTGNDAIVLYLGAATGDGTDATVVDSYGRPGENGTSDDWDYDDTWACREDGAFSDTYVDAEWQHGSVGYFDGLAEAFAFDPISPREFVCPAPAPTTHVFVNELHYDDLNTDTNEGFEIAGPAGTDLTGWTVVLYDGGGAPYANNATVNLSGVLAEQRGGYGMKWFGLPANGIQNGGDSAAPGPDGLALVNASTTVVQFVSWEGTFTASSGIADGKTSVDIGVAEGNVGDGSESLQINGCGRGADAPWGLDAATTHDLPNVGQTFAAWCP